MEFNFETFINETIPCALFHIGPSDLNEKGIKLDEIILVQMLNDYPEALKHRSLVWYVNTFIEQK